MDNDETNDTTVFGRGSKPYSAFVRCGAGKT
jgi:hypothetical protein